MRTYTHIPTGAKVALSDERRTVKHGVFMVGIESMEALMDANQLVGPCGPNPALWMEETERPINTCPKCHTPKETGTCHVCGWAIQCSACQKVKMPNKEYETRTAEEPPAVLISHGICKPCVEESRRASSVLG